MWLCSNFAYTGKQRVNLNQCHFFPPHKSPRIALLGNCSKCKAKSLVNREKRAMIWLPRKINRVYRFLGKSPSMSAEIKSWEISLNPPTKMTVIPTGRHSRKKICCPSIRFPVVDYIIQMLNKISGWFARLLIQFSRKNKYNSYRRNLPRL